MAKQQGKTDRHWVPRMAVGPLGLWALLHGGGVMAQGLYIAPVPTVCMTPVAGSKQAVALPYVVARELQSGGKVPSLAQACQQMNLKAVQGAGHRSAQPQTRGH